LSGRRLIVAQMIETIEMGGAEKLALQIANAHAAAGHLSFLFVMTKPGPLSHHLRTDVALIHLGLRRGPVLNLLQGAGAWLRRLKAERIQILQTHLPQANYWGWLAAATRRCSVLATVHNNREFDHGPDASSWRGGLRRRAYRSIVGRCPRTIAVSEEVRRSLTAELDLGEADRGRLDVVPNGVVVPPSLAATERLAIRRAYRVTGNVPLMVGAGRLTAQKNFQGLIDAAAVVAAREIPFLLVIAGEGPLRADLEERIRERGLTDRVRLPGNMTDLGEFMQAADLFVLPSLWERLPLVLLEAMARGLPVVGNAIPGTSEVVESAASGLLVEPGRVDAFADAMATLLADPELRSRYGSRGRHTIQADFSFERVLQRLDEIHQQILPPAAEAAPWR